MLSFSDQMKTFVDDLIATRDERFAAVTGVKEHTDELLSSARNFLQHLSDEHRALAERSRSELAADALRLADQVKAFRESVRREHREASQRLQSSLKENKNNRQESVRWLSDGFRVAQRRLAKDFQAASQLFQTVGQAATGAKQGRKSPHKDRAGKQGKVTN